MPKREKKFIRKKIKVITKYMKWKKVLQNL